MSILNFMSSDLFSNEFHDRSFLNDPEYDWLNSDSIKWYLQQNIHLRIQIKSCFELVGLSWEELSNLFSIPEKIEIFYQKLKIEGFEI